MNKKTIKSFYLSLIDNPDAIWTYEKVGSWGLYHCKIGNINIKSYPNFQLTFTHTEGNIGSLLLRASDSITSETVSFNDIGISKFRLWLPFFGICAKLDRRINREKLNKDQQDYKINSISNVLKKDKALVRDTKIDELLK